MNPTSTSISKTATLVLFMAIFLSLTSSAQNCTNLLANPGFESGLNGWSTTGDANTSTNAHSGNSAGEICGQSGSISQIFTTTPGTDYTASTWGKVTGSPDLAYAWLRFLDASYTPLQNTPQTNDNFKNFTSSSYQQLDLTATAPSDAAYVHLLVWKENNGCVLVDDMELCEGAGTPTTVVIGCSQVVGNTATAAPGETGAIVNYFGINSGTTCPQGGLQTNLTQGLPSGSFFSIGETEVCYEATDACGDAAECCFIVTVNSGGSQLPDFEMVSFEATQFGNGNVSTINPGDEVEAGSGIGFVNHFATLDFPVPVPTVTVTVSGYLSEDQILDPGDVLLDYELRELDANVQAAGFTEGSFGQGIIPISTPPGNYFLIAKYDGGGHVVESDETNNTQTLPIVITSPLSGGIDLELSLAQPNPSPAQWSSYDVVATLMNTGTQAATGVEVSFAKPAGVVYTGGNEYTASQGSFNPNGNEIWTVGNIPAGGSATMTVNYFLLANTAPDAYAQVSAANETDADSTPGNGTPPTPNEDDEASTDGGGTGDLPDLAVINVQPIAGTLMTGDVADYVFEIRNQGAAASGDFKYAVYLSTDATLSADDILVNQYFDANGIPAGNTQTFTVTDAIPAGLPNGQIWFLAVADVSNIIMEESETNNVGFNSFYLDNGTAGQPDLTISNFEIPAPIVEAGQILHYNFDLANEGGVNVPGDFFIRSYISTNTYISSDDIQDGTILTGNFNAGFSVESVPGASTIPSDLPTGQYYLIVKMDADDQVAESNESNNIVFAQFNVTNTSVPPGDCETEVGFGTFTCAEYHAPGELAIFHDDLGSRELTIVDMDAQVLSNQITGPTPPVVNEYISGNRLVRVVDGIETFSKDLPTTLLDQYEAFTAWLEYNGGYLLFAFDSPLPSSNLYVIETDIDLNVISSNLIPGFTSSYFGPSIRTPQLIAPNRIAFIFQPPMSSFEDIRLVVMDENFDIKTDNSLGSGFYSFVQLKEGACGEWELVVNIGLSFCTHGACYVNTRSFGSFANDNFVASSRLSASEFSAYGQGTRSRTWGVSLPSGTAYNAILTQALSYPPVGLNNDVTLTKTTGGTFVWEKTVTVPDAISIVAIQEVGGELYFIRESMGVLSMLNVDCLENTPPPGDGVDLELSMSTNNPSPAIYSSTEIELTLTNTGSEAATGIVVDFPRPSGTVYTGGNEWTATQGSFNPFGNEQWTVGSLPAGGTASITVSYFLLSGNALTPYAQVISQNEMDVDSSPGNGTCCTPNEDDEATLTLNAFAPPGQAGGGGGNVSLKFDDSRQRMAFDKIYPNPAQHFVTLEVYSAEEQDAVFDFYDQQGRAVLRIDVVLAAGRNKIEVQVGDWKSGAYNVIGRGEGMPAYGRFLKVWEE